MRRRAPSGIPLASMMTLVIAALVLAATIWNLRRTPPMPDIPTATANTSIELAGSAFGRLGDGTRSELVLANDPFDPDRTPAVAVDDAPPAPRDTTPVPPPTVVRLLGTVVRAGDSFALCQLQSDPPRIVRVGERLGDLLLLSIEQGRAVFRTRDGSRVDLSLNTPGA